ncbi:MAG TPA: hypothetical protein VMZ00_00245 [Sporichthya sp.]|nr:hypothetical protein [Sporichthya sp.]
MTTLLETPPSRARALVGVLGAPPGRAHVVVVGVLAFVAAAVALYLRLDVFDLGSANNDEGVYLRQAQALADGHLVVPFHGPVEAHQPWLFAIGDDGYISKYLPVAAGCYALGIVLFGSPTPVLVAMAAAVPVLTYLVARAMALPARRAVVAAGLVGLSPAVLVQGGLLLSYLPLLVLVLGCWLAAFRAVDARPAARPRWAVAAALLGALTVCTRPLDGLLLVAPLLLWVLWHSSERKLTAAALFGGGVPIVGATLLYNAHVTGNPLKLPFSLLDPMDKAGFGPRRFFPEDKTHDFGLHEALEGTADHFFVEPAQWMFGFLAVLMLALWAIRRRGSAGDRHRVLVGSAGGLLGAYFFFWGPWHASVMWGGTRTLGPFYSVALFPPLVFAALTVRLGARTLAGLLALASIHPAVNGLHALERAQRDARITAELMALVDPSVTTLLEVDQPYTGHPLSRMNGPTLLLASQAPPSALPAGPNRILSLDGYPYRRGTEPRYELRESVLTSGSQVRLDVRRVGYGPSQLIVLSYRGATHACYQGYFGLTLTLTAEGVSGCSGAERDIPAELTEYPLRSCPDGSCLGIATMNPPTSDDEWGIGTWRRLPLDRAGNRLSLITDGAVLRSQGYGWISVRAD